MKSALQLVNCMLPYVCLIFSYFLLIFLGLQLFSMNNDGLEILSELLGCKNEVWIELNN